MPDKNDYEFRLRGQPEAEKASRMEPEIQVRRAKADDAIWIVDISTRVQKILTASGSLQHIGPLPLSTVQISVNRGFTYLLELNGLRIGSVFVEPLDGVYPNTQNIQFVSWEVENLPGPLCYLQSLMIEPMEQGKGLGLRFLDGIRSLMREQGGTVVLDCWAGNSKLRDFYQRAGFIHHGNFPEDGYEISVYFQTLERFS